MIYFDDLEVNRVQWSTPVLVDKDEMLTYARNNDPEPFHVDEELARRSPFGGLIASGGFSISLLYRLIHAIKRSSGEVAFLGGFEWHVKFAAPVRAGDQLRLRQTVLNKRPSSKPGRGVVQYLFELVKQRDEVALSIESTALVATRP